MHGVDNARQVVGMDHGGRLRLLGAEIVPAAIALVAGDQVLQARARDMEVPIALAARPQGHAKALLARLQRCHQAARLSRTHGKNAAGHSQQHRRDDHRSSSTGHGQGGSPHRLPWRTSQCMRARAPATSRARRYTAVVHRRLRAMSEKSLPTLSEVEQACRESGLATPAPELHGSLCGWLAGGGDAAGNCLARVMVDDSLPAPAEGSVLARLQSATRSQFEDREFGLVLLGPDDDASLAARSGALFDWCRGFVGAFGLAAGGGAKLSEEGEEALADLARLARATAQDDGDEEDEAALAEIEEF